MDPKVLEKAILLAKEAHKGQKDKGGAPYIEHPMRVMAAVRTTDEKIIAVLHDVMEDTSLTVCDLKSRLGLSDDLLYALQLLTRDPYQNYMDYIRRLAQNPLAAAVKAADLEDNMNLSRLPSITPKDLRRTEKYSAAKKLLHQLSGY